LKKRRKNMFSSLGEGYGEGRRKVEAVLAAAKREKKLNSPRKSKVMEEDWATITRREEEEEEINLIDREKERKIALSLLSSEKRREKVSPYSSFFKKKREKG